MKTNFDYIVLGLGGLGSAAAYWLSRRAKHEVLGIEQFELGHVHGESQDHSRIIRLSYHTPGYVTFAKQAYAAWSVLESDEGHPLIVKNGGLDLWPPNAAIPMSDYTGSLDACNVSYEILNGSDIRRRYPQWNLDDNVTGLFQADGGIAPAAKCNLAHQQFARAHGATILERCPVTGISAAAGGGFDITTARGNFSSGKLIIANGPWTNRTLQHFGCRLPLTVTQEQVTYFAPSNLDQFSTDRFPIWIWMDEPSFYGFPVYGEAGIKIGQDVGGKEVSVETRSYDPDPDAFGRVQDFIKRYLPSAVGDVIYTKSCLYTLTPDRDFVIDELPGFSGCYVTVGAGHAFKFASIIGKVLSEMAIDGRTETDVEPFRMDRPILQQENPPKSFMI